MPKKFNEHGIRLCNDTDCPKIATHHVMWTDGPLFYCNSHALYIIEVGDAMGFGVPRATLRPILPAESNRNILAMNLRGHLIDMLHRIFLDEFTFEGADVSGEDIRLDFRSTRYNVALTFALTDEMASGLDNEGFASRIKSACCAYITHAILDYAGDKANG